MDIHLTVLNKLITQGMSQTLINDNVLHFTMEILGALAFGVTTRAGDKLLLSVKLETTPNENIFGKYSLRALAFSCFPVIC